jgi:hypothetical protein
MHLRFHVAITSAGKVVSAIAVKIANVDGLLNLRCAQGLKHAPCSRHAPLFGSLISPVRILARPLRGRVGASLTPYTSSSIVSFIVNRQPRELFHVIAFALHGFLCMYWYKLRISSELLKKLM